jgi:hypothetical protein
MKIGDVNKRQRAFEQLGMPRGTAQHRLRKLILFDVLQRHNENICYRCGEPITSVDELSVEHKQSWENVDVGLFWDLNNIAFSHLTCNCSASGRTRLGMPSTNRKICPEGMGWCNSHKEFLPVEQFYKDGSRWDGRNARCIECHKTRPR